MGESPTKFKKKKKIEKEKQKRTEGKEIWVSKGSEMCFNTILKWKKKGKERKGKEGKGPTKSPVILGYTA